MTDKKPPLVPIMDDKLERLIKVSVEGQDIRVVKDVNEATAFAVISVIMGGSVTPKLTGNEDPADRNAGEDFKMTLREYLSARDAESNPKKIAAIGWYLMNAKQKKSFTNEEILKQFDEVREPRPTNISQEVTRCIKKGWITSTADHAFIITGTGQKAVESNFSKEIVKKTAVRRKKAAKGVKRKSAITNK